MELDGMMVAFLPIVVFIVAVYIIVKIKRKFIGLIWIIGIVITVFIGSHSTAEMAARTRVFFKGNPNAAVTSKMKTVSKEDSRVIYIPEKMSGVAIGVKKGAFGLWYFDLEGIVD